MLLLLLLLYLLLLAGLAWRRRGWLGDALIPGLLGLLTLAFFWRVVSGDAYTPADGGDLGSFLYPTYAFIQRSLRAGVWPLWNPHIYSGVPFTAEVQSGILYPLHLLRFLLGPDLRYADMQWLALLHIWWAGTTLFWLGRGLGLRRAPALLAGVAFMFSDLFILHLGNLNLIAVASWLPLGLLGVHRTLIEGGRRWALAAGLALGVAALAGHVQMTLYSLMAVALWVGLWLLLSRGEGRARWRRAATALILPALLTLGLMAPLLLPGLEMAALSPRADWNYVQTVGYSLSPAQLIGLLIPGFFGRGPQFHWGLWPRVEVGYAGVLTLMLALVGVGMRRQRLTWLLLGVAAAALAFSLGIYAAGHGWLTWLLPGLEQLRAPARFIFLFDLALALLAGFGLQALLSPWEGADRADFARVWRPLRSLLLAAIAVGGPVVYAVLLLTQAGDPTLHLRASIHTIAFVTFLLLYGAGLALLLARRQGWIRGDLLAVLAVALLFVDLASLGANNDLSDTPPTAGYEHQALIAFLRADPDLFRIDHRTGIDQLWQPDAALLHGLEDIWGVVNPLTLSAYEAFLESTGSRSSDRYGLLNVKYVLAAKDVTLDWEVWEPAFTDDAVLNVYRNRRFQPRVRVWEGAGQAQVLSWSGAEMIVRSTMAGPGLLLVANVWVPGWQASIDRGPWQAVQRVEEVWQGVAVPAGEHEVRLRFRSPRFSAGLIIALLTLAGAMGMWAASKEKGR